MPQHIIQEEEAAFPSKTQRKREMLALQKLGDVLVAQSLQRLARLALPDALRVAILACKTIKSHEARRRQSQYIGKLMRGLATQEIQAIQAMVESWQGVSRAETLAMQKLAQYRAALLEDDAALTQFLAAHPVQDAQPLRALIRKARKEKAENLPPQAYRALFQYLRETVKDMQK